MKLYKNMLKIVDIVIETLYYHTDTNLHVSHADTMYLNESMNTLKYNVKKINFINRLKYAEQKIYCICIDVYKIYESSDYDKIHEVLSTYKN